MTLQQIFLVIATVLFVFAAVAVTVVSHPLEWGLASFAFSFLVGPVVIIPFKRTETVA